MPSQSTQQSNLSELVTELRKQEHPNADPVMSPDFRRLLDDGLHHTHLPDTLHPKAAEMLQLAAEGIGGLPRLIVWADKNPGQFYKLFARMTIPTIKPVLPEPPASATAAFPPWLTARRHLYLESVEIAEDIRSNSDHGAE